MQKKEKKQKWLPPYNTIFLLSILAAVVVTIAFAYFSTTFFLAERTISRRARSPRRDKNVLRVLIAAEIGEQGKTPLEVDLLPYLSKKLGKQVVPVQRQTPDKAENVMAQREFDIAFTSEQAYLMAKDNNYAEALVIPVLKNSSTPQTPISVRKDIDLATKERIRKIFLNMSYDKAGRQIISALGIKNFMEPSPGNYIPEGNSGN